MLTRGSASLQPTGIGSIAMAHALIRRAVVPPDWSEWWTGALGHWRCWPPMVVDFESPAFNPSLHDTVEPPARYAKQQRYRKRQHKLGRCPRCGGKRPCQQHRAYRRQRWNTRERGQAGYNPWRPGSSGQRPLWVRAAIDMLKNVIIPAIRKVNGLDDDGSRAVVVLWGGLWAHFDVEIIAWITGYDQRFVQQCAQRLIANGVWYPEECVIACSWLDDNLPPSQRELAFWADSLVALGMVTRAKDAGGEFLYQVVK